MPFTCYCALCYYLYVSQRVFPLVIKQNHSFTLCSSIFIFLLICILQVKKIKTEEMPRSFPQPAPSGDPESRLLSHRPDKSLGTRDQFPLHSPDRSISFSVDGMNLTSQTVRSVTSTETFNRSVYFQKFGVSTICFPVFEGSLLCSQRLRLFYLKIQ